MTNNEVSYKILRTSRRVPRESESLRFGEGGKVATIWLILPVAYARLKD